MRKHWKSYSLIGVILLIIVSALLIYHAANKPAVTARREAVSLAEKYAHVTTVDDFYWFNRKHSYLTVAGQTKQHKAVFVIIAQKGGKITVLDQSAGISRNTALKRVWRTQAPKKVYNAALGLYHNKPVWEVSFADENGKLGYQTLAFKTGKSVKLIKNI
ncbi:DUF5590 domain-containing protein [Loigolactobacillus coryniformis]|uniref:Cell wall elongation regulator TseB-like domain-containing protein n=1 Tax=Loigolactobacillus coryniformis TaxID=1610 RepID=A0A5B8TKL4_9LACO|nr:DUF5590 domain-containing protein [Loigolactobacillus coryniformis]QEA53746.1 hypothetical protein FGL77_10945 [Loigolactobacillus coryniformis]